MKDKQSSLTASGIVVARAVESEKAQGVRTGYAERAGEGVHGFLAGCGFVNISDVSGEDLHQHYFSGLNARRKVAWGYGIASGEVV